MNIELFEEYINEQMKTPEYSHYDDAGFDLQANLEDHEVETIFPGEMKMIKTGLFIALPDMGEDSDFNWELQIRPRSGIAYKNLVTVLNTPGTIDAGYRKEIGVLLFNHGERSFDISAGDRIAQGVVSKAYKAQFNMVHNLNDLGKTGRDGGFGSTGV